MRSYKLLSLAAFLIFSFVLFSEVKIYYYYDPIYDSYIFTNQCDNYKICMPLMVTKGKVKHKRGYRLRPGSEKEFDAIVKKAAKKYKMDFYLIKSVIKAESLFDKNAVSTAGARGLMQLMPKTAKNLGVENSFDPEENIMGGTKYLKRMIKKFGKKDIAVAAYNAGPAAVTYYNGIPPYKETQEYVRKIKKFYLQYTKKKL